MTAPVQVGPSTNGGPTPDRPQLTDKQLRVLRLIAAGKSRNAIATSLGTTPGNVANLSRRVFAKLGAVNAPHAVFLACQTSLLEVEHPRRTIKPRRHGDHAGFVAHKRRGEEPCVECRAGEKAYKAERWAARKATHLNVA
ncbi:helix-turn-helix transcriptional regulator [Streptomyces olivaceiscleroticus]|uniref:HTH luxR-type domain-containing protein n=1 Tax=Streptomyces olivaceiscleroticus TaxID=68245 RepID=A0ABN1BM81_9ACTN